MPLEHSSALFRRCRRRPDAAPEGAGRTEGEGMEVEACRVEGCRSCSEPDRAGEGGAVEAREGDGRE